MYNMCDQNSAGIIHGIVLSERYIQKVTLCVILSSKLCIAGRVHGIALGGFPINSLSKANTSKKIHEILEINQKCQY